MNVAPSRRAFFAMLAAAAGRAADKPLVIPTEARKFRDPATEFELLRLTDPTVSNCWLPRLPLRSISLRSNSLIYCSDRTGSHQVFRMDLKSGESRQLTQATRLAWQTAALMPDDRSITYFDGADFTVLGKRPKVIYSVPADWQPTATYTLSDDGAQAATVETRSGRFRVRVIGVSRHFSQTIFEADAPVRALRFRPKRQTLVYNHAGELWIVNPDGGGRRKLPIDGEAGDMLWSADGRAVHYLSSQSEGRRPVQLRECDVDSDEDKLIGSTTQFVTFARNADSSVFAGISGSKAAPYVLLLLRAARRELTVAEHKASDTSRAVVLFAPNSQRIYYHTDREGKSAIYSVELERFIEKTETTA
jgi:oligogalacturonide lyase